MSPGSLVVIGCSLQPQDKINLLIAGHPVPNMGKDIYEVKSGPYLISKDGHSYSVVTFQETGIVEWNTELLLEVAEPEKVDIQTFMR